MSIYVSIYSHIYVYTCIIITCVGVHDRGCLCMYYSEGRVEAIELFCFIFVILYKFKLYKYEG